MKLIIRESSAQKLVFDVLDKLIDVKNVKWKPIEDYHSDGSIFEDPTRVYFYLMPYNYESIFKWYGEGSFNDEILNKETPYLQIDDETITQKLDAIFGDESIWGPPFKEWFKKNFKFKVKTIWS